MDQRASGGTSDSWWVPVSILRSVAEEPTRLFASYFTSEQGELKKKETEVDLNLAPKDYNLRL